MAGRSNRNYFQSGGTVGGPSNPTQNPLLVGTPVTNPSGTIGLSTNTANHWTGFQINSISPNQVLIGTFDQNGVQVAAGTMLLFNAQGLNISGSGGAVLSLSSMAQLQGNAGSKTIGLHVAVTSKSANYTASEGLDDVIECTGAAAFTVTLPTPVNVGKLFVIKNLTSPVATITISAAINIDGAASQTITTANGSLMVIYDGTTYSIIGKV